MEGERIAQPNGSSNLATAQSTSNSKELPFDCKSPVIQKDIISIILQYLESEGYEDAVSLIRTEAKVRENEVSKTSTQLHLIKSAILEGEWEEVENIVQSIKLKNLPRLQYFVSRQHYFELIEKSETNKALEFLNAKLKPFESQIVPHSEFQNLCYLLTCKSVKESSFFKGWNGIQPSRQRLADQIFSIVDLDTDPFFSGKSKSQILPPNRLIQLLSQAVKYQVMKSKQFAKLMPRIGSLIEDYSCTLVPNVLKCTLRGHTDNVKCVTFIGENGDMIASGSSDKTLCLWQTNGGQCLAQLRGHNSRIWDVCSNTHGQLLASASGDCTIKLWSISHTALNADELRKNTHQHYSTSLAGHQGDVYSVHFSSSNTQLLCSGGYDRTVRLWDSSTSQPVSTLTGHSASVTRVLGSTHSNPNLILSASKDCTVKLWDRLSGTCVRTLGSHLGEVTSIELSQNGQLLLTASKDNSNRLWDLRGGHPIQRFKGHQNTSKNFVRTGFGPSDKFVISGSEDGFVYIWDSCTAELVQCLGNDSAEAHEGTVYSAVWSSNQSLLASCAHDNTVKLWCYEEDGEESI